MPAAGADKTTVRQSIGYMRTADYWAKQLEFGKAVAAASQAIALTPNEAALYSQRAGYRAKCFDFKKAVADYRKATSLDPKAAGYQREMGKLLLEIGQPEEGLVALSRSIQLEPTDVGGYMWRSNAYEHRGQYDKAVGDLRTAVKLAPKRAEIYEKLGADLLKVHHTQEAIDIFTVCIKIAPDLPASYYGRADAYSLLKNEALAQKDLAIAHKLDEQY